MTTIQSIRLTLTEGSSDKEYQVHLIEESSGKFLVNGANGRRNGTLTPRPQTPSPVGKDEAQKIFDKLVKKKVSEGYSVDGANTTTQLSIVEKVKGSTAINLLIDKEESDIQSFIDDDDYIIQQKFDGERRSINKNEKDCVGGNKKSEVVGIPVELIKALSKEKDVEVDGELIGSTLYVFDVLRHKEVNLKNKSYMDRLAVLHNLKLGKGIVVVETAVTREEKIALVAKLRQINAEGFVAKKKKAAHVTGRTGSPCFKVKFYKTATVKVSALTKGKRSVKMSVVENGKFIEVGAVTIPVNKEIPKVNDFIEVRYLYAYKGGSLFQPVFEFLRTDVDDSDAGIEQLKYKAEDEDEAV